MVSNVKLAPPLILVPVLLTGLASPARSADASADELARGLQKKYDTIKDFSADFVHQYQSGVLKKQRTERGRLLVRKPGQMRWESEAPERSLVVSDGKNVYLYVPDDKQVTVSAVPADDEATTPALFLAGKGNLTRDFTVAQAAPAADMPAGTLALKLVPRKPQPDYDWLVIEFEAATYRLRGLMTSDAQGGVSSFSFTNLKENVGLADKEFVFKPPRGVDVVTDSRRR